jgi:NHL repeat-containing protein
LRGRWAARSTFRPTEPAASTSGDQNNNRIQKFDSAGNFLRAWGKDVASAGPGNIGIGFEICIAANGDTCKAGVSGALGGEMNKPLGVANDAAGNLFITDANNNRIQKFIDLPSAPPSPPPPSGTPTGGGTTGPTGLRAAALKKCKKKRGRARRNCIKRANKLPV